MPSAGRRLLQGAHSRILPVVVVAHLGVGHGAPHVRCRSGDRVTAQVDQAGHAFTLTGPGNIPAVSPAPAARRSPAVPERRHDIHELLDVEVLEAESTASSSDCR